VNPSYSLSRIIIAMEVIQHKETVNVNFSAAFFEGFVWH